MTPATENSSGNARSRTCPAVRPTLPEIPEMTGYAASTMATDGRRAFVHVCQRRSRGVQVRRRARLGEEHLACRRTCMAMPPRSRSGRANSSCNSIRTKARPAARSCWPSIAPPDACSGSAPSPRTVRGPRRSSSRRRARPQIITLALPFVMSSFARRRQRIVARGVAGGRNHAFAVFAGGLVSSSVRRANLSPFGRTARAT